MPKAKKTTKRIIPHTNGNAIDALVPTHVDWNRLEHEFVHNKEHKSVQGWFRNVKGWPESRIRNGHFFERTKGWGSKRVAKQESLIAAEEQELLKEERDRRVLIRRGKNNVVINFVNQTDPSKLEAHPIKDQSTILKHLKTELGEPNTITKSDVTVTSQPDDIPVEEAERIAQDAIDEARRQRHKAESRAKQSKTSSKSAV